MLQNEQPPKFPAKHYISQHNNLRNNRYYPFNYSEFALARIWLKFGLSKGAANAIIGLVRSNSLNKRPCLNIEEVDIRSTDDIETFMKYMPEGESSISWEKHRVTLPKETEFADFNKLPDHLALFVYVRSDIIAGKYSVSHL